MNNPVNPVRFREDLDAATCSSPHCKHKEHDVLWMHPSCHPRAALSVCYDRAMGWLELSCSKCRSVVVAVAVAPRKSR